MIVSFDKQKEELIEAVREAQSVIILCVDKSGEDLIRVYKSECKNSLFLIECAKKFIMDKVKNKE